MVGSAPQVALPQNLTSAGKPRRNPGETPEKPRRFALFTFAEMAPPARVDLSSWLEHAGGVLAGLELFAADTVVCATGAVSRPAASRRRSRRGTGRAAAGAAPAEVPSGDASKPQEC